MDEWTDGQRELGHTDRLTYYEQWNPEPGKLEVTSGQSRMFPTLKIYRPVTRTNVAMEK